MPQFRYSVTTCKEIEGPREGKAFDKILYLHSPVLSHGQSAIAMLHFLEQGRWQQ